MIGRIADWFYNKKDRIDEAKDRGWLCTSFSWSWKVLLAILILVMLYIPYIMWTNDRTNVITNIELQVEPKQSYAVAAMIWLMEDQLNHNWIPNNPFWEPSSYLDNTPNLQMGVQKAVSQFAYVMAHILGRTRSSSSMDEDLDAALGRLNYAPDVWHYDSDVSSIGLSATSEAQYRKALESLTSYQERLSNNAAVFDIRPDSLLAALRLISNNIGSLSANTEGYLEESSHSYFNNTVDDVFFSNKGQLYAYYMILRELGIDFKDIIVEKKQTQIWDQMLVSLEEAATMKPSLIFNGDVEDMFMGSHLANQGFYMLLTDRRMKEVIDGMLK